MRQMYHGARAIHGIGRPQVLPVLGREVVEREELREVLLQARAGLEILSPAGRNE